MATSFNNLDKLKVDRSKTARHTTGLVFKEGEKPAVFITLTSTEKNEAYTNALLRSRSVSTLQKNMKSVKAIKQAREEDIVLYAKYVIQDWENVFGDDGKPVVFSREEAMNLFDKLAEVAPDEMNEYRVFCGDLNNFRESIPDVVNLSGNS